MIVQRKCLCCGENFFVEDYIEQDFCNRCNQERIGNFVKTCKEFQKENNKLLDVINKQDVKIADLEEKLKTSLDYNKSLLNALKNYCSTRLNGGLIERAESFLKEVK